MRFRLTYEGELQSTQGEPRGGQVVPFRMADHKHKIRKVFHRQLKRLWETNKLLSGHMVHPTDGTTGRSAPKDAAQRENIGRFDSLPLMEAVANQYRENDYRFVPLVREDISVLCSLKILFLRRDIPGRVISAGDLDNRIKTLIDALRRPKSGSELKGNETPGEGEDPFFVLLEDDDLVSELVVETDELLDPPTGDKEADMRHVRLVVTVEIRPYNVTMFNLAFS